MQQTFRLSKKVDASLASRVLYALEESGIFQHIHVSVTTGFLKVDSKEHISVQQVEDLLKNIKEINIEEISTL